MTKTNAISTLEEALTVLYGNNVKTNEELYYEVTPKVFSLMRQSMTELATTENLIAQYRENYNKSVTAYNRYVKKFPTRIFLDITGYENAGFERLNYDVSESAPQNLFDED